MSINTNSNGYVMAFAIGVCVVMSSLLALTATALKPAQEAAAEADRQKNVMIAAGVVGAEDVLSVAEVQKRFGERVQEVVVDTRTGQVVAGKSASDIAALNKAAVKEAPADKAAATRYRVVAKTKSADGKLESVILPISGKGLWSTIYGYLALDGDLAHVRGVTFYKHGETPGLGGECENPVWCAQWKGKSILDAQQKLVGVAVKKGQVDPAIPAEKAHKVDGLSGATITSNGITKFVLADLQVFDTYLASLRKGS
jgi:Na+-transporting NADH:ubiquinone oxidoreductase subunit C